MAIIEDTWHLDISRRGRRCFFTLLSPPVKEILSAVYLLLQLENAVQQGLGGRRAARDVYIDGNDPITAAYYGVRIMVIASAIGAAAH